FLEQFALLIRIADAGDVIGQGIDPDIHHVSFRTRNRNAPIKGGARNGKVLQPALYEGDDLIAALFGSDKIRVRLVQIKQLLLVSRETKKVSGLFNPFD